jgi:hypothetical protein
MAYMGWVVYFGGMLNPHALPFKGIPSSILKYRSTTILLFLLALALAIGSFIWFPKASEIPLGMTAPGQPLQESLQKPSSWVVGDYTVTALASYQLTARILGKKAYQSTDTGDIAPFDLALGWSEMSDSGVLDKLKITQSGRWFYVYWRDPPIAPTRIMQTSANTHILPANDVVVQKLEDVKKDQVVFFQGHLVEVTKADGFVWRSSLSRDDTGNGSCEIFWVEDIRVVPSPYLQAQR